MLIVQPSLLLERYLLAFEEASMACITSINISARKGVRKTPVGDAPQVVLVDDGLENEVAPSGFVFGRSIPCESS